MECKMVKPKLVRYMDRDLPPGQYEEVSRHLDHCYLCSEELTELVAVTDAARDLLRCGTYRNRFDELAPMLSLNKRTVRSPKAMAWVRTRQAVIVRAAFGGVTLAAAAVVFMCTLGLPAVDAIHALHSTISQEIEAIATPVSPECPVGNPLISWGGRIHWAQSLTDSSAAGAVLEPQTDCSETKPMSGAAPLLPRRFGPFSRRLIVPA